jgi:hypothetical protein
MPDTQSQITQGTSMNNFDTLTQSSLYAPATESLDFVFDRNALQQSLSHIEQIKQLVERTAAKTNVLEYVRHGVATEGMFSAFRRVLGLIEVVESGDKIRISGLPGDSVMKTIFDVWGTNKIAESLFSRVTPSEVEFNRFFAPDVVYAFTRIVNEKRRNAPIRALRKVIALMYEHTWMKDTLIKHPDILDRTQLNQLKWGPLEHQDGFFNWFNEMIPRFKLRGALLGAGPGTGKTFMGLSLSLMLHSDVCIIVCPPRAVKKVWEDTIVEQFKRPAKYWHSQMGGLPKPGMKYYIVHYDFLEKFLAFAKQNHWQRPVILLDESHGLNEIEALRTQLFIELCNVTRCQYVLWESGTPVKALGGEMAPLFRTIDPMFDEDAQRRFSAIYGKSTARANDILAARLGKVTYKVDSNNVVKVEVTHIPLKVQIPNGQDYTLTSIRKEMRAFIEERIAHYKSNFRTYERMYDNAITAFERTLITDQQKDQFRTYLKYMKSIRRGYDPKLHKDEAVWCNKYEKQVIQPALPKQLRDDLKQSKSVVKYYKLKVQGEALGQVLGKKRGQCIVDMVPHMGLEKIIDHALKKTLIFTSYVPAVDAAGDYLKSKGYHPLRVYGETNNELAGMVNDFGHNEDANPMIATYQSLSSAVPLVMANVEIMMNSPFRSFEYDQAVARVKRLGQDENVQIWDVVLDTGEQVNISSRTIDIMNWSREQVNEIMGFENAHLIAAESYVGMGLNTEPPVDFTPIVMDEFADNMVLNGWAQEGFMESNDPFWAQWGTL